MKISKLHIEQFRQLENLTFDFTYPNDFHIEEKRGKPLDKICFIGQSATGKTSLLELIDIKTHNNSYIDYPIEFQHHSSLEKLKASLCVIFNDEQKEFCIKNKEILINYFVDKKLHTKDLTKKIFFPSELNISKIINFLEPKGIQNLNNKDKELFLKKYNQFKLGDENYDEIYKYIANDFVEYQESILKKASDFLSNSSDKNKFLSDLNHWMTENPNPNLEFATKLNIVLKKLNLEVDINNTLSFLKIKNSNTDNFVPVNSLSTGTKLLISLLLPLYKFDTEDSIILIDEPERSLYPDIQMELMDYYKNLGQNAQFIVATHSPFIAASFEPDERFILYFNDEGKVEVRRGISPIGDDPNDMLFNDFGVNYYNDDVQEKFKEYLELLDKVKSESNKVLKKKYLLEASKLGNQYNFVLDEKNKERLQ
ncbi:AAA family ATPase [Flavobacterium branchiicola]|uniref:AAA family ATPase n=1 Tax=Flavobacterium branchiicola TaxID=1114875 RepID=A0ABV9PJS5_9FLAO|nr:AAA family ATPase [Flavobacterium branchiicola]MBS7255370.1 AAA family ATPase [Flavobacterium branchiicola]